MKKTVVAVLALLFALPIQAKEAIFTNGVLKFDSVLVGADTYSAELTPVPNVTPLTFTVTKAIKVATAASHAAVFSGTSLTIPNVLIGSAMRAKATLILTGQNPYRFQLSTYSVLRTIELNTLGQTLTPGRVFTVNYTGGVLTADKVKLKIGTTQLQTSVLNNAIAATVPVGLGGSQTLTVELDGDSFQWPLTIAAGTEIASPKPYITGYVNEIAADLKSLGMPASLLDTAAVSSRLGTMSEADAKVTALQIRENLEPLLAQVAALQSGNTSLTDSNFMALTLTTEADCARWMKGFATASAVTAAGVAVTAAGFGTGPGGLIIGAVGAASTALAAEVAIRNMKSIVNECGALNDATFTLSPLLQSELVLTKPIEVYESRARSFQLNEVFRVTQTIRSSYLSTATVLKSTLTSAIAVVSKLGLGSGNPVVSTLTSLAAAIKTDDTTTVSTDAQKFSIRAISDASITGSNISGSAGKLTLLFDKKNEDLAEGKSVTFTIELYNATDGVSITVPVKLNGASLLEDLKAAVVGDWIVGNMESGTIYDLELKVGGTGVYRIAATSCATGLPPVAGKCEYKMTWSIVKNGSEYILYDYGFWHPAYNDPAIVRRGPLTLPVNRYEVFNLANPPVVGVRYTKL